MFHRRNTSSKKPFLKNFFSRARASVFRAFLILRFHRLQRHHKIAILVTGISIFMVSIITMILSFSGDSVFGQVRFQLVIRTIPACYNGIDDDGDGLVDYPSDPSCTGASDISEGLPFVPPVVACFASATQGTTGQNMTWIAIPSYGNGTYTYTWSGTDGLTGTTPSITKTYTSTGTKTASLMVTS
jgi:hypothetical protein